MTPSLLSAISHTLAENLQHPFTVKHATPVSGGDIHASWRIDSTDGLSFFVKVNQIHRQALLKAEAEGLNALAATRTLRTPHVIANGTADGYCFLILEHLTFSAHTQPALLGQQLAQMHRHTASQFGFAQDNFIGNTPQANTWRDSWIDFWREQRLLPQLHLAKRNGYGHALSKYGTALMNQLPKFFEGYDPVPALLHGDLWSGNHAYLVEGTPVIFDAAPYYGDRETDLAMTELFGGFSPEFYSAYRQTWPLHPGYSKRKPLYNLYHILNHANLFGGGYMRQAEALMRDLLD